MPNSKPTAPSLKTLRKLATTQSFERGEDYYAQGTLTNLLRVGDRLQADCWGSQRYEVQVKLNNGDVAESDCTCPYDWGGLCKHRVALLLTYLRKPDTFTVIEDLDALLEAKSKPELVALVKTLADKEPRILRLLAAQAELKTVTAETG